jgi:hypothetical protein
MKTLNDSMSEFIGFMGKYTDPIGDAQEQITNDSITLVMKDIQEQTLSELDDEIHSNNLIKWEHDSDGDRMNTDNLMEWLSLYYTVEKK